MIGFEYKGINSSTYGIFMKSKNRPSLPVMRKRFIEIYGKHGSIDFGQNNYSLQQISLQIIFYAEDHVNLLSQSRVISDWLASKEWGKLIFDDEPDKYYLARIYEQPSLKMLLKTGQADIKFECQPFAYMVTSTNIDPTWNQADFPWLIEMPWNMITAYQFTATEATSFTFEHPGTQIINQESPQGSKFDLIISGAWTTLSLTLNGKTIGYTEAGSGTLIIDSVDMETTLNGINKLNAITGDIDSFLSVIPGSNVLQVLGTGLNVTVTIDFIPMWL